VLYYEDRALGDSVYLEAITREVHDGFLCEPVTTSSSSEFATLISSEPWDLIIAAHQAGYGSAAFDAPLADYVCGGGKVVMSDWRRTVSGAATTLACSDTAFDGRANWTQMTSTSDLFAGQLQLQNPGWSVFSVGLTTDAVVYATNELLLPDEHDVTTNSLGLPIVADGLLTFAEDFMLQSSRGLYHPSWGLELAWDTPGASFTETLADDEAGFDARHWQALSFRILQLHADELNPPDQTQDLHVRLIDVDGDAAQVALSDALQGPLRYAAEPWTVDWKSVFETYRLPLADFVQANPALNLRHLAAIEFVCDITDTGRLVIDDIEFASRNPGEIYLPAGPRKPKQ
jgi:hypothetical protein